MIKYIYMSLIKYPTIKLIINIGALLLLRILLMEVALAEEYTIQVEPIINTKEVITEIVLKIGAILLFASIMGNLMHEIELYTIPAISKIAGIVEDLNPTVDDEDSEAKLCDVK